MSNLARKIQRQQIEQPKKIRKITKQKRKLITKGEKVIYFFFAATVFFCSYKIVATQSAIYQVNKDIQLLDAEISEQMQATEDLQSEINSLLEYERVLGTAKKQGLETNKDRVKVVAE